MSELVYFSDLAGKLGVESGMPPAPAGGPDGPGPGGTITHPNTWRKEGGEKLLQYLKERYHPGDTFVYDGHADCWLMLAVMDQLKECTLGTYIGAGFNKTLPIVSYKTGAAPADGQPCTFTIEGKGDDLLLTVHLVPDKSPFDMYFGDIVAPELPAGKNIFVRLDGRHLLFTFPISLTYGAGCRSIVMDYNNECFVSVSNTPELAVGDLVENPFADAQQ